MTDEELLKAIMAKTSYNQSQIARIIGSTRQYIGVVYNGKGNFSYKLKSKLRENFPDFFDKPVPPTILTASTIKQFRKDSQLSQKAFAKKLGIHQSVLSHIEAGEELITTEFKNNFYKMFSEETDSQNIYYCPEVAIPNDFTFPQHPEVIKIDKRLLRIEKGLTIDYNNTYLVSISGDNLLPEYHNNDYVLLDTSHTSFKDGYTYFIRVNNQNYVRRVNVSPNKVKCIPFNNEQDAFVLEENEYEIVGLIVPHIRL